MILQFSQSSRTGFAIKRRGIAMMLVMVAIVVIGGMTVAYFGSRDNSIAISSNIEQSVRARAVAESGLDIAIAILETNTDWRSNHIDGVILDNYLIGGGTITITLLDSETGEPPTESTNEVELTVVSTIAGLSQTTQADAIVIPEDDEFDVDFSEFAIFTRSGLSIQGIASVQNWSSSPMASSQPVIQIGTLATSPMSVRVDSWNQNSQLELLAPSSASSMVSTTMAYEQFPDVPPFPNPPPPPSDNSVLTLNSEQQETVSLSNWASNFTSGIRTYHNNTSNSIDVEAGNYIFEEFELSSEQSITVHGDVVFTIESDLELKHATIILADEATLTMHVRGGVDIKSSYIGNANRSLQSWMDPNRVQLFGHGDSDWEIRGLTIIKGELYAPDSDVDLRGNTTICGRVAADEVTIRGASRLLYDQTLDHGGFADEDSSLYDEHGDLYTEIQQLVELAPFLINAMQESLVYENNAESQYWRDWRLEATDRPNTVLYVLVVYGIDARHWEELARQARRNHNSNSAIAFLH